MSGPAAEAALRALLAFKALQLMRSGCRWQAAALLELAAEESADKARRSISEYARCWDVSRHQVRRLLSVYDGAMPPHSTESRQAELNKSSSLSVDTDSCKTAKPTQMGLEGVPERPSPIVNLLPKKTDEGDPVGVDERIAWWQAERDQIIADSEVQAVKAGATTPHGKAACLKSTAIRYFRAYLKGERPYRGVEEARKLQEATERYLQEHPDRFRADAPDRPSARLRQGEVWG